MNILTKIIEGSNFFICIIISIIKFLLTKKIIKLIFLGLIQKFKGIVNIRNVLSQFKEKYPVAGSNTENKLFIIFKLKL